MEFLAAQGSAIEDQIKELTALRAMLAPWLTARSTETSRLGSLNARYTMQSEREIHTSAAQVATASGAPDDNLEFFDTSRFHGQRRAPSETSPPATPPTAGRLWQWPRPPIRRPAWGTTWMF